MATYTTHSMARRAEREIKQTYIELCLRKGERHNIPNHMSSPSYAGAFVHRHYYHGLIVLSVPNTTPPTVITAYWTAEAKSHYGQMIDRYEQRLRFDKQRRAEHAAKNARPAKPVKSSRQKQPLHGNSAKPAKPAKPAQKPKNSGSNGSKSTRARTVSVNVDAEDLDDLDY